MTKKLITCPNCNARIESDHKQVIVFCMYCGANIQTQDIVEVRHVDMQDSLEKLLSDGETYYKLEDYYRAEHKFREVIREYPKERKGYEELIRTLTRNQTVYPLTYELEVYRLLEQLELLIAEEEQTDFEERRRKMKEAFEAERIRAEQEPPVVRTASPEESRSIDRLIWKIVLLSVLLPFALLCLLVEFNPGISISTGVIAVIIYLVHSIWKEFIKN